MATQEEINKFVEMLMNERVIEAKIASVVPATPTDLEPDVQDKVDAAQEKIAGLMADHSALQREEYLNLLNQYQEEYNVAFKENAEITERNWVKIDAAAKASEAEVKALTDQQEEIKASNDAALKDTTIIVKEIVVDPIPIEEPIK